MNTNLSRVLAISVLAFFTIVACKEEANKDTAMAEKIPGIVLENMDTSVSPKEDFYNYVNGTWMKTNTIPDDESRWGGFGVLRRVLTLSFLTQRIFLSFLWVRCPP